MIEINPDITIINVREFFIHQSKVQDSFEIKEQYKFEYNVKKKDIPGKS